VHQSALKWLLPLPSVVFPPSGSAPILLLAATSNFLDALPKEAFHYFAAIKSDTQVFTKETKS
jgi:hypothetical protein